MRTLNSSSSRCRSPAVPCASRTYSLLGEIDRSIDLLETCLPQFRNDMKLWFTKQSPSTPKGNSASHPL
jgi:hypothetical protein